MLDRAVEIRVRNLKLNVDEYLKSLHETQREITEIFSRVKDLSRMLSFIGDTFKKEYVIENLPILIVDLINKEYGVNVAMRTRKAEHVKARKAICYFLSKYTLLPLNTISEYAGLGHHATVIHHKKEVADCMGYDDIYRGHIYKLDSKIKEIIKEHGASNDIQTLLPG